MHGDLNQHFFNIGPGGLCNYPEAIQNLIDIAQMRLKVEDREIFSPDERQSNVEVWLGRAPHTYADLVPPVLSVFSITYTVAILTEGNLIHHC